MVIIGGGYVRISEVIWYFRGGDGWLCVEAATKANSQAELIAIPKIGDAVQVCNHRWRVTEREFVLGNAGQTVHIWCNQIDMSDPEPDSSHD